MTEFSFRLRGLTKSYSDFKLGPIDLDVEPGAVLAFVGPNGAGKTTTLHCMMDLVRPTAGAIEIAGDSTRSKDPSWKQNVGFVGEVQGYYRLWTVKRNFAFLSKFYPNWSQSRVDELCSRFGLDQSKRVNSLSQGNRRKMALVAALAHRPRVLLFDEPTSGLDPVVRAEVLDVLWEVLEQGDASIFYSTHVLSDISRLADEIVFLRDGKLLGRHEKEALLERWRRVTFRLAGRGEEDLPDLPEVHSVRVAGSDFQLTTADFEATAAKLAALGAENLHENHLTLEEISVEVLRRDHVVERARAGAA